MRRVAIVLGWCLGVVATVLWLSAYNAKLSLESELQELSEKHEQTLAQMDTQVKQMGALLDNVSDMKGQLKEAERKTVMLEDAARALPDEARDPGGDVAPTNEDEPVVDDEPKKVNPFAEMFGGEMSEKVILASARMNVETQYGDFLNGLDVGTAEHVRLAITQVLLDQMEQGMSLMQGELSADEISKIDYEQRMRDELSYFLTPEELAAFDEYQATLPERMLERSYGVQLDMYASGLSQENRAMVLDVLVEEMLLLQNGDSGVSSSSGEPASQFAGLIDVFGHVRERFAGVFDEGQQAILDRFLEQQESMFEMMLPMMESMQESLETNP